MSGNGFIPAIHQTEIEKLQEQIWHLGQTATDLTEIEELKEQRLRLGKTTLHQTEIEELQEEILHLGQTATGLTEIEKLKEHILRLGKTSKNGHLTVKLGTLLEDTQSQYNIQNIVEAVKIAKRNNVIECDFKSAALECDIGEIELTLSPNQDFLDSSIISRQVVPNADGLMITDKPTKVKVEGTNPSSNASKAHGVKKPLPSVATSKIPKSTEPTVHEITDIARNKSKGTDQKLEKVSNDTTKDKAKSSKGKKQRNTTKCKEHAVTTNSSKDTNKAASKVLNLIVPSKSESNAQSANQKLQSLKLQRIKATTSNTKPKSAACRKKQITDTDKRNLKEADRKLAEAIITDTTKPRPILVTERTEQETKTCKKRAVTFEHSKDMDKAASKSLTSTKRNGKDNIKSKSKSSKNTKEEVTSTEDHIMQIIVPNGDIKYDPLSSMAVISVIPINSSRTILDDLIVIDAKRNKKDGPSSKAPDMCYCYHEIYITCASDDENEGIVGFVVSGSNISNSNVTATTHENGNMSGKTRNKPKEIHATAGNLNYSAVGKLKSKSFRELVALDGETDNKSTVVVATEPLSNLIDQLLSSNEMSSVSHQQECTRYVELKQLISNLHDTSTSRANKAPVITKEKSEKRYESADEMSHFGMNFNSNSNAKPNTTKTVRFSEDTKKEDTTPTAPQSDIYQSISNGVKTYVVSSVTPIQASKTDLESSDVQLQSSNGVKTCVVNSLTPIQASKTDLESSGVQVQSLNGVKTYVVSSVTPIQASKTDLESSDIQLESSNSSSTTSGISTSTSVNETLAVANN